MVCLSSMVLLHFEVQLVVSFLDVLFAPHCVRGTRRKSGFLKVGRDVLTSIANEVRVKLSEG